MLNNTFVENQFIPQLTEAGLESFILTNSHNNLLSPQHHDQPLPAVNSDDWSLSELIFESEDIFLWGETFGNNSPEWFISLSEAATALTTPDLEIGDELTGISSTVSMENLQPDALLDQAVAQSLELLQEFAQGDDVDTQLLAVFGSEQDVAATHQMIEDLVRVGAEALPTITVLPQDFMPGMNGAFAASTQTIYLSEDFLTHNATDADAVIKVLAEEIGHYIDAQVNQTDTPGDEGAIFADVVDPKSSLSAEEWEAAETENDYGVISVDGQLIDVEQSSPAYPGYYLQYTPGAVEYDYNVKVWQQQLKDLGYTIDVDGYFGSQSEAVTKQFQSDVGFNDDGVDGIVGFNSWTAAFLVEEGQDLQSQIDALGTSSPSVTNALQEQLEDVKAELKSLISSTTPDVEQSSPDYPGYYLQYTPGAVQYDPNVKVWQQQLKDLGYTIGVDGYFGSQSDAVTKQFQNDLGFDDDYVDGIVGFKTWNVAFLVEEKQDLQSQIDALGTSSPSVTQALQEQLEDVKAELKSLIGSTTADVATLPHPIQEGEDGRLGTQFKTEGIPIFDPNNDKDGDGLNDEWENTALLYLNPLLVFDEDEDLFDEGNKGDKVINYTRITPHTSNNDSQYVLFMHTLTFSRDYGWGPFDLEAHDGDTESVQIAWEVIDDYTIQLRSSRTKGHKQPFGNGPFLTTELEDIQISSEGAVEIYIEENKHGTFASKEQCENEGPFDCGEGRQFQAKVINIGEPPEVGSVLVDETVEFPGEFIWADAGSEAFIDRGGDDNFIEDGVSYIGKWLEDNLKAEALDDMNIS